MNNTYRELRTINKNKLESSMTETIAESSIPTHCTHSSLPSFLFLSALPALSSLWHRCQNEISQLGAHCLDCLANLGAGLSVADVLIILDRVQLKITHEQLDDELGCLEKKKAYGIYGFSKFSNSRGDIGATLCLQGFHFTLECSNSSLKLLSFNFFFNF